MLDSLLECHEGLAASPPPQAATANGCAAGYAAACRPACPVGKGVQYSLPAPPL